MSFFSKTPKPLVGVDLGPSTIKVVELGRVGTGGAATWRLERYGMSAMVRSGKSGGGKLDAAAVGKALESTMRAAGIKAKRAATAVAGASVITKVIALPEGLSERELEALVQLEADQYIPYPLDEVKLDYQILGPSAGGVSTVDVLLAASHSEIVDDRAAILQAAGLEPACVDAESFAIQNAYEQLIETPEPGVDKAVTAIVDIGATGMSVMVLHEGRIVYDREQNIGGDRLTDDIAARYRLDRGEAEMRKRSGELPDDYGRTVLQPFIDSVATEIRGALNFYLAAGTGPEVTQLLIAGGSSLLPGLLEAVSRQTEVEARYFNPLARVAIAPRIHVNRLKQEAPALAVACGLALRRFDP